MLKRLMIGLFAVSMTTIWAFEAHAVRVRRDRRSVETTITCTAEEDCQSYSDLIVPPLVDEEICAFTGTLICAPRPSGNGDLMEAVRQLTITIEDCKKGQRKGHYKDKGKGHEKKKGKGHTLTCPTTDIGEEEGGVPPPAEEGGLPAQGDFVDDEVVFESEIPNGDALCEEYFPGEDLVFVTFWINEFYGITEVVLGEGETVNIYQYCVLPANPDEEPYDCVDIPNEDACDVIPQCGENPIPGCGLPPVVDLVFAIDNSGSMGGELDALKGEISNIMDGLQCASPSTDFNWAVVSYQDHPGFYDSSNCGDPPISEYEATYGGPYDSPFDVNQCLTPNKEDIVSAVTPLLAEGGADLPQDYGYVFWELSQPVPGEIPDCLVFRPDAQVLVVNFGDDVPHDPNLNEGIDESTIWDTGIDPGRDGELCTADDVDFHDALAEMVSEGIKLLHIDSSGLNCEGGSCLADYWGYWTGLTGGDFAAINSDGTVPGGLSLSDLILDLLGLPAEECEL